MKNIKRRNSLAKKVILLIIFLILVFLILLVFWFEIPLKIKNISKEPQLIPLKDECSIILNNLVHQINDEGTCKIKCINECNFKKMKFYNSAFTSKNNSCNLCNCYCK